MWAVPTVREGVPAALSDTPHVTPTQPEGPGARTQHTRASSTCPVGDLNLNVTSTSPHLCDPEHSSVPQFPLSVQHPCNNSISSYAVRITNANTHEGFSYPAHCKRSVSIRLASNNNKVGVRVIFSNEIIGAKGSTEGQTFSRHLTNVITTKCLVSVSSGQTGITRSWGLGTGGRFHFRKE